MLKTEWKFGNDHLEEMAMQSVDIHWIDDLIRLYVFIVAP